MSKSEKMSTKNMFSRQLTVGLPPDHVPVRIRELTENGASHGEAVRQGERPANPIPPARAFGIMFADDTWLIERTTRMTEGSGELGHSARLPALVGNRGREILGRNNSFH
jgi:hypothetical protein